MALIWSQWSHYQHCFSCATGKTTSGVLRKKWTTSRGVRLSRRATSIQLFSFLCNSIRFLTVILFQVLESYWNGDSTILAMIIRFDQDVYGLQLWTMANYHWYMKHFCPFKKGLRPLWVMWDVIETNRYY